MWIPQAWVLKVLLLQVEFNEVPCQDLFSDKKFPSARDCVQYCKDVHGFDIDVSIDVHLLDIDVSIDVYSARY